MVLIGACSKASDSTHTRELPKLPPPPAVVVPASLSIAVEIDGKPAAPIDSARLAAAKPDFQDVDHRAWRLSSLLGARMAGDRAVVAVTGDNEVTVQFRRSSSVEVPVLALTRRGEIVAALVDPADPFPSYHTQGRRLHRPGDPAVRLGGVKNIRLFDDPK
jgi:hypothetical protein